MQTVTLQELRQHAREVKRELGIGTPEWEEKLRNKGRSRTPEKRELLRCIQERALEAGLPTINAYF